MGEATQTQPAFLSAGTFTVTAPLKKETTKPQTGLKSVLYSCLVQDKFRQPSNESCFTLPLFQPFLSATSLMPKAAFIQLHTSQASKLDHAQRLPQLGAGFRQGTFGLQLLHSNTSTNSGTREGQKEAVRPDRKAGHYFHSSSLI